MNRLQRSPLLALMTFCMLSMALACKPTGTTADDPPFEGWPDVVECGPDISDVIGTVTNILLRGTSGETNLAEVAKDELKQLAEEHGANAVVCAIDKLAGKSGDWFAPGATQTPERMGAAQRGRNFLESESIEVQNVGAPSSYLRDLRTTWPAKMTARLGFIPTTRDLVIERPWHTLLAGARGVHS
jgi:hypothetical protein